MCATYTVFKHTGACHCDQEHLFIVKSREHKNLVEKFTRVLDISS